MNLGGVLRASRPRSSRGSRGAAAVEFALVMIPLLMLIFGVIQYGFYFMAQQSGSSATNQAARRLSVGDCTDSAQLKSYVSSRLGSSLVNGLTVTKSYLSDSGVAVADGSQNVGDRVSVTVTFNTVNMHFPFIPVPNNGQVSKKAEARVENLSASGACS